MDMYFFQNETLNGIIQSGSGNGRTGSRIGSRTGSGTGSDPTTVSDGLTDSQED